MTAYAVIICARMASERLPGKALAELAPGLSVLRQLVLRWRGSNREPTVIVAGTSHPADDALAEACRALDVPYHAGQGPHALGHMDQALRCYAPRAEYVARALADNPLVDVDLADWRLDKLREEKADGLWYGLEYDRHGKRHGVHERITYAGTTDVWSRGMWDEIAAKSSGSQMEHPGAYWFSTLLEREEKHGVIQLPLPRAEYISHVIGLDPQRTELDEPRDLEMLRAVWKAWREEVGDYPCVQTLWALRYLSSNPEIAKINRGVRLKTQTQIQERSTRKPKLCPNCRLEHGQVSQEGIEQHCSRCGKPIVIYHAKPRRKERG